LQLAAIEAGGARLSPRAFELRGLVDDVIEAARARIPLEVERPGETWLLGDPLRIGQVLRNLVDNALKFTSEGEVRVKVTALPGEDVELIVSDTGSGIDPAQVERLLAPFERASRERQGVGLGLSIVQRLVASMRGTLQIDGQPGVGTTVRVRLPLAAAQPEAPTRKRHSSALVVDDSAAARELLTVLLKRAGYRVYEAANSKQALARFAEAPCELVLLDYQMPDADGIETALALRRLAGSKAKLRIFLLTANVFARGQVAERGAAIDGILEKPISRATLLSLLEPELHPGLDARVIADLREVQLFDKLLASTRDAMKAELRVLARAAKAHERAELARSAHRIAGHAGMIGARAVAERARSLEDAAERARFTTLDAAATQLRKDWSSALRALEG
ncbi:MAG TPA: ATP-binding protein, partial [Polyangiales bacterium]|nr:ATP-binding protein [Polyangiales bacterium]